MRAFLAAGARARARVGGVDAPRGHVVDDPRPLARRTRARTRRTRDFRGARPFGGSRLVRLGPRGCAPRSRIHAIRSTPPIPPPHALTCLRTSHPPTPSRSSRTHRISRPGRLLARFWGRPREPTEDSGGRLSLPLAIIPFVAAALHQLNSPSLLEDDADLFSRRLSRPPRAARVRAPRVLAALRAPPPPRDRREGVSLPRVARV